MNPTQNHSAVQPHERIVTIDVIRGFALLGILFVNFPQYTPVFNQAVPSFYTGIDAYIRLFYDLFIQTKFYTIFSFLFGWGFFIFMSRSEQRGDRIFLRFTRRLIILLLFGLLHRLFWFGDILVDYAILGFGLFLFYRLSALQTAYWAALFSLLFMGGQLTLLATSASSWLQLLAWLSHPNLSIFAMFLWGMAAGKGELFQHVEHWLPYLRQLEWAGLIIALPAMIQILHLFFQAPNEEGEYYRFIYINLTAIPLALCYLAFLTRILHRPQVLQRWRPVGDVGRMALTNYLLQTIIGMGLVQLFHFHESIPLTSTLLLTPIIFSLQVLMSRKWLQQHRYGPLEWLWRHLTYGTLHHARDRA